MAPIPQTGVVAASAPAKINLHLHITGRDDQGYHLLETLFAFTEFGDQLELTPGDDFGLSITGPFAAALGEDKHNLIFEARALLAECGYDLPACALALVKNIPVAAGLGGGSADAAAYLRLMADLVPIAPEHLFAVNAALGADGPACLSSQPAIGRGRGEQLQPLALPQIHVVLANPGRALQTRDVFAAYAGASGPFTQPREWPDAFFSQSRFVAALRECTNDLEPAAVSLCPEITDVLQALAASEGCLLARMSGSGATCFALFPSRQEADNASASLGRQHPDWWVVPTRLRASSPVVAAL